MESAETAARDAPNANTHGRDGELLCAAPAAYTPDLQSGADKAGQSGQEAGLAISITYAADDEFDDYDEHGYG